LQEISDNKIDIVNTGSETPKTEPVFVDTDNVADENITALADTIKEAIEDETLPSTADTIKKYRHTLIACIFSVLTFSVAINLVPILIAPLMEFYSLPVYSLAILVGISFIAQMIILLSCSRIPDKVGVRPVLLVTSLLSAVGFLLLFLAPYMFSASNIMAGLIIAAIVYGIGAGFMTTMLNPIVNALPLKNKERTLTLFHTSFAALMVIAIIGTTLGVSLLPSELWNFVPLYWIIAPLICFALWLKAPIIRPNTAKETDTTKNTDLKTNEQAAQNKGKISSGQRGMLVLMLIATTVAMASEAIIAKGSSLYIDVGLDVPKLIGDLLGPAMFAVGLGIGRLLYGLYGKDINIRVLMVAGSAVCFALYLVAVFTPFAWVGVVALALVGFSVSLLIPGMIVETGKTYKSGGVFIFVLIGAAGKIGAAGGPALFGLLAGVFDRERFYNFAYSLSLTTEGLGLRAALLICAIFPLASTIFQLVLLGKNKKKSNPATLTAIT